MLCISLIPHPSSPFLAHSDVPSRCAWLQAPKLPIFHPKGQRMPPRDAQPCACAPRAVSSGGGGTDDPASSSSSSLPVFLQLSGKLPVESQRTASCKEQTV